MTTQPPAPRPITVVPATPERWPDIADLFAGHPCWCQYWRVSAGAYGRSSPDELAGGRFAERCAALREQLACPPAPGVLAYLDDRLVGWCGFGPQPALERLVRSRTIPAVDPRPVWAIVCFLIRVGYRRRGVARALLQGVIAYARKQGGTGADRNNRRDETVHSNNPRAGARGGRTRRGNRCASKSH
jgi:GNAT superfamily N-acetyltransferase